MTFVYVNLETTKTLTTPWPTWCWRHRGGPSATWSWRGIRCGSPCGWRCPSSWPSPSCSEDEQFNVWIPSYHYIGFMWYGIRPKYNYKLDPKRFITNMSLNSSIIAKENISYILVFCQMQLDCNIGAQSHRCYTLKDYLKHTVALCSSHHGYISCKSDTLLFGQWLFKLDGDMLHTI